MTAFRKPQFRGERAQTRADEALLCADNDATCWLTVQEYEKLRVSAYPATLVNTPTAAQNAAKFPVFCETSPAPTTEDLIIPADFKTVGMDACIVLEEKHGGERDAEARVLASWDNAGAPLTPISEVNETVDCVKRFVRLRAARLGTDTYVALKVLRGTDTQ